MFLPDHPPPAEIGRAGLIAAETDGPDRIGTLTDEPCAISIWQIEQAAMASIRNQARAREVPSDISLPGWVGGGRGEIGDRDLGQWVLTQNIQVLRARVEACETHSRRAEFSRLASQMDDAISEPTPFRLFLTQTDTERGPGERVRLEVATANRIFVLSWRYAQGG
jgi:hypothetical protein